MESQLALLTLICQLLVSDNGRDALGGLCGSALFGGLGSSHCVLCFFTPLPLPNHFFCFLFKAVMAESQFLGNLHIGMKVYVKAGRHPNLDY